MTTGAYSVVRSIPDPIRGEAFNVGVVVWTDDDWRISLDDDAAQRAINRSPFLAKDAWAYYESYLRDLFIRDGKLDREALERYVAEPRGETLRLTKPAYVRVGDDSNALEQGLNQIMQRLVRAPRGGGGGRNPVSEMRALLRRHIDSGLVQQKHPIPNTRSGVPRTCDFFANSGANVALDALQLGLAKATDAHDRIDAEATRVADVLERNALEYVVYCRIPHVDQYESLTDRAQKVLSSVGAQVVTSAGAASDFVDQALERQTELALC
jgi:hypothetical protein